MNIPVYKLADIRFYEQRFLIGDFYCDWNQKIHRYSKALTLLPVDTGEAEQEWLATLFELPPPELESWVILKDGDLVEWPSSCIRLTAEQMWQSSGHWVNYKWKDKQIKHGISSEDLLGFWSCTMPSRHIGLHEHGMSYQWARSMGKYSKSAVTGNSSWTFNGDSSFSIVHNHPKWMVDTGLGTQSVMSCRAHRHDGRCMEVIYSIDAELEFDAGPELLQYGPIFGWWIKSKPPKWYRTWIEESSNS